MSETHNVVKTSFLTVFIVQPQCWSLLYLYFCLGIFLFPSSLCVRLKSCQDWSIWLAKWIVLTGALPDVY